MEWEKVKTFLLEHKVYVIGAVIVTGLFLYYQHNEERSIDNSKIMNVQSSSAKSAVNTSNSDNKKSTTVTCDISGAVKKQGVYTLHQGARLDELINSAGGITKDADLKTVNRAIILKDQDKIHIPYRGEKVEIPATESSSTNVANSSTSESNSTKDGTKIHLNTATAADLQKLNGIGAKKAEQIIAYREQNGAFKKIEDLTQVSGIGDKTFAALKDQLDL